MVSGMKFDMVQAAARTAASFSAGVRRWRAIEKRTQL
jgi:hypothetical protein